jgi:hypothetical protein
MAKLRHPFDHGGPKPRTKKHRLLQRMEDPVDLSKPVTEGLVARPDAPGSPVADMRSNGKVTVPESPPALQTEKEIKENEPTKLLSSLPMNLGLAHATRRIRITRKLMVLDPNVTVDENRLRSMNMPTRLPTWQHIRCLLPSPGMAVAIPPSAVTEMALPARRPFVGCQALQLTAGMWGRNGDLLTMAGARRLCTQSQVYPMLWKCLALH